MRLPAHTSISARHDAWRRVGRDGRSPRARLFPESGMISLVAMLRDGHSVESVIIGHDGVFGTAAAATTPPSFVRAIVQISGSALRVSVRNFKKAFAQCPALRNLMLRYSEGAFGQRAACGDLL
jgi:hypothetical protein